MQVVLAFEDAVVCDLRKDFFYSASVAIKSCVVHFFCWQPTFGTVALNTMGEGSTMKQRTQFLLRVLHGDVMRAVVRWYVWSVHVHVRVYMGM